MSDKPSSTNIVTDEVTKRELKKRNKDKIETNLGWVNVFRFLSPANDDMPGYGTVELDRWLRNFSDCNELLSGVKTQIISRQTGAELQVYPSNAHIEAHRNQADVLRKWILRNSENGLGLKVALSKFYNDALSTNNGGFLRVIANGKWDTPAIGVKTGLVHMDSLRCVRTGVPEFPVIYQDGADWYPLHASRVIMLNFMPHSDIDKNGIGYSPVYRTIDAVNRLSAIWEYYAQKMGAKSPKGFLVVEGMNEESLADSIIQYEVAAENADASLYGGLVPITSVTGKISIDLVSLTSLPEKYSEEEAIYSVSQIMGLQFCIDPNSIFRLLDTGGTKTSSVIEHVRNGGQLYRFLTEFMQDEFNDKVLPPYLKCKYDADDAILQELRVSTESNVAKTVTLLLGSGAIDARTSREILVKEKMVTPAQFESMELNEGRTESGENLISLLFSEDPKIKSLLKFDNVENILDIEGNDNEAVKKKIQDNLINAYRVSINSTVDENRLRARQAIAVLETLLQMYEFGIPHWTLINRSDNPLSRSGIDITQSIETSRMLNDNGTSDGVTPKTEDVAVASVKRDASSSRTTE